MTVHIGIRGMTLCGLRLENWRERRREWVGTDPAERKAADCADCLDVHARTAPVDLPQPVGSIGTPP